MTVHVARCWSCGCRSPPRQSETAAQMWRGWHATGRCSLDEITVLRTSEVRR